MDPTSAGFMLADSRNTPMHVGGLQLYTLPDGAGPDYVRDMIASFMASEEVAPLFIKRPFRSIATGGQWFWTEDGEFDLEHHVRHAALPQPGRIRELLDFVGRIHGNRLSFERPLWEFYVIEGLEDGRIATYTKMHHALVDGVSSMRLLQSILSTDPDERDMPPPWASRKKAKRADKATQRLDEAIAEVPISAFRTALGIASDAAGMPSAFVKTLNRSLRNEPTSMSWFAPKTILNKNVTGARRFAAEDWPIERIKAVGKATGTSLNDVVLAMCGGALRTYLEEQDALPDVPLISMVPVGLKAKQAGVASAEGGNAVGSIMVKLGTHLEDPAERLQSIHNDMRAGKEALSSMTQMQIIAMAAIGNTPTILTPMLRLQGIARPPYNVVISNVPGPKQRMYLNGATLDGMYPVSIPINGIALNITCTSYVDNLAFGFTGCRRTVPHLQRLLVHVENELEALEKAAAVA
ncbi:MAG TPA: wax ester/triacylglycerol synthase family O-acyltransferase [Nocardioidaceae bacterium]|nr:wax ester/triacylglycerol synthase family O-acyltransferase [Nocardioidaceae bacterium]